MANITRLRAIETRRYIARCSNGGETQFYDAFGNIFSPAKSSEGITNANMNRYKTTTFFSDFQWFYPIICVLIISIFFVISVVLLYEVKTN